MFTSALLALLSPLVISAVYCLPLGKPFLSSQCVPFRSSICNSLGASGYDHTPFPHPLSPDYIYSVKVLESVANEIIERTVSSKCSPYAAKFLCFAYFPFCAADKVGVRPIVPCKPLCERVKEDCKAENIVNWLSWDCDRIGEYSAGGICVGINDTPNITITAAPPSQPNESNREQPMCPDCNINNTRLLNSSTYTAVSKVSVISRLVTNDSVTYNVTVDATYVPEPCANTSQGTGITVLVLTSRSPSCTCPYMEVGASYLVSSYHEVDSVSNPTPTWNLTSEWTASLWSDSYAELLTDWGTSRRNSSTPCL